MSGATPEPGALSARRAVYLIARREFATRIRGKVFSIGTIIAVALLALYVVLQLQVIDRINTTTTFKVGFSRPGHGARPAARGGGPLARVQGACERRRERGAGPVGGAQG